MTHSKPHSDRTVDKSEALLIMLALIIDMVPLEHTQGVPTLKEELKRTLKAKLQAI